MTIANVNIRQILLKKGNTARSQNYTGPIGEITLDTDLNSIRVHNGITAGGVNILATQAQIDTLTNSISTITGIDSEFVSNINTLLSNAAIQQSNINDISSTLVDVETAVAAIFDGTATFGNLIPSANVTYNLGSPEFQWGNLYVSSDTIYIAGIPLRVDSGGNLTINGNSVGGGTLSGSQLFNGEFTATLDNEGHLIANQFIAAEGTDNGTGYSFYNDGGFDTGMFSPADGQLEFHNNATQSATVDDQGNWKFNNPIGIGNVYNLSGVIVQNADLSHGSTASLVLPANGSTGEGSEILFNNTYSDVVIGTGTGGSLANFWRFGTDGKLTFPNGAQIEQYNGNDVALFNPSGNTVVYSNHDSNSTVELRAKGVLDQSWTFNDRGLTFPDGTVQTTAYVHNNVNMDGGGASTVYEVETAYADGGFASIRSFSETFDGNEGNNYILDGGRA